MSSFQNNDSIYVRTRLNSNWSGLEGRVRLTGVYGCCLDECGCSSCQTELGTPTWVSRRPDGAHCAGPGCFPRRHGETWERRASAFPAAWPVFRPPLPAASNLIVSLRGAGPLSPAWCSRRAAQTALYASSGTRATRPRFPAPLFPLHRPVAPGPSLISVRPLFSPASGPGIRLRSSFSWNALLILFPESLFPSCPSAQPPLASSRSLPCPVGFSERSALSSFRTPIVPWNRKRKATAVRSRDGRSSRGRQEKQWSDALPRCSLALLGRLGKGRWPARCRLLVPPIA